MAQDHLTRAKVGRDTVGDGEIVEPHCDEMQEMNQHDPRKARVWESADDALRAFLDNTNTLFYVPDMFASRSSIHIKHGYMVTYFFELNIHQNQLNSEASPCCVGVENQVISQFVEMGRAQ